MFKLLDRQFNCTGIHRSGWPYVMSRLSLFENKEADLLLDDFVEHSFVYRPPRPPHTQPWVGIFHHPANINSPIHKDVIHNQLRRTMFKALRSLKYLKGVIVLSKSSVPIIRTYTSAPILVVKHPTAAPYEYWKFNPVAYQVGFFLRDTRMIYRAPLLKDWKATRSDPWMGWARGRDNKLKQYSKGERNVVENIPRLDDVAYDHRMATSVVFSKILGAAANNVVVECIARGTPIVVNRLPELEWYLGSEYPLFYNNELKQPVTQEACEAASEYLNDLRRDSPWLEVDTFVRDVTDFITNLRT